MADLTAYPTASDIEVLLKSISAWPIDDTQVAYAREESAICMADANAEWERVTGWHPFVAGDADQMFSYQKTDPYGKLNLRNGLLSITSVILNVPGSTTETLVQGQDFEMIGLNAPAHNLPYTDIRFIRQHFAYSQNYAFNTIQVTGRWGYCTTIPANVWNAILKYGAQKAIASIPTTPNLTSLSQDGFSMAQDASDSITQRGLLEEWGKNFYKLATGYKRL